MDEEENVAWYESECKENTLFRLSFDEAGNWRKIDKNFSPSVKQKLLDKYGIYLVEIANETKI